jgi:hypothetical protein
MGGILRNACLVVGLAGVCLLSGCASSFFPGGPSVAGGIYTEVSDPAQNLAVATTASSGAKRGEASAMGICGLVAQGDASLEAAMKNGGITKVHHVDHQVMSVLGLIYVKTTTIVYGE